MTPPDTPGLCDEVTELLRTRRAIGRSGRAFDGLPAMSTENNLRTLHRLICELRPVRSLEVGLSVGGSCLVFTAGQRVLGHAAAGQHVAIDPFQSRVWDDAGLLAVERAGLSGYLEFRSSPSALELPRLLAEGSRFDFVYVDGSHLFEDVFVDAYYVTRLLSDGGVVAFDDSPDPHVRKVLGFIRSSWRAGLEELDLSRFREDGGRGLPYQVARRLGRVQLTAFRRIGPIDRPWNAPFRRF